MPVGDGFSFAAVDDGTNELDVWHEPWPHGDLTLRAGVRHPMPARAI